MVWDRYHRSNQLRIIKKIVVTHLLLSRRPPSFAPCGREKKKDGLAVRGGTSCPVIPGVSIPLPGDYMYIIVYIYIHWGYPPPTNSEIISVHFYEGPPINLHFPLLVGRRYPQYIQKAWVQQSRSHEVAVIKGATRMIRMSPFSIALLNPGFHYYPVAVVFSCWRSHPFIFWGAIPKKTMEIPGGVDGFALKVLFVLHPHASKRA